MRLRASLAGRWFASRKARVAGPVQQKITPQPEEKGASHEQAKAQERQVAPQLAPQEVSVLAQPIPKNEVNAAIERHIAQRHKQQDQQELYSSVWAGLAAAIIKTQPAAPSSDFRRRVEQLVQELSLAEERERKRKRGVRDETFFRSLVSLLGEKEAETVQQKIETLQKTPGTNAQDAAQLAKDIAAKLSAHDSLLALHTGTQSVERPGVGSGNAPEMRRGVESQVQQPAEPLNIRHPLNHPVPEVRDALIQMAQPNVSPSGGNVSLPEIEPIARQLFPAAKNLGFTGTRDQFTEALYMLSHRVESAQGIRADQILHLTEQSLSQNGEVPNSHLVSIMTDVLARVQYAKAASINSGEAAHFVLRDGEKPAEVRGQVLADNAAQVLEGTGGFGLLGSHGFGPPPVPAASAEVSEPVTPVSLSTPAVRGTLEREVVRNLDTLSKEGAPAESTKIAAPTGASASSTPNGAVTESGAAAKESSATKATPAAGTLSMATSQESAVAAPAMAAAAPAPTSPGTSVAVPALKKIVAGAHTAENLEHNPEIALPPNSEAPKFKVSSVAELTKSLKELGTKAAQSLAHGEIEAARNLELQANDSLLDNKALIAGRSMQEQAVIKNLAIQTKAAELKRLEEVKASAEKAIATLQAEVAKELASKAISGKVEPEKASALFTERTSALLAQIDPDAAGLISAAERGAQTETFLKELSKQTTQVAEADRKAIEQEKATVVAKLADGRRTALQSTKAAGKELDSALEASAAAASAQLEKRFASAELQAALARNPEALASLREVIAAEKKRATEISASAADFVRRAEKDLLNALQFNPDVGQTILSGPEGARLLHGHLAGLKNDRERIGFLSSLKIGMGQEKFAAIIDGYDKATGRPLTLDIVEMSEGVDARRDTFKLLMGSEPSLLNAEQKTRVVTAIQRDTALTQAAIREELKHLDGRLDANAKRAVEARRHLATLLGKSEEELQKLPFHLADAVLLQDVRTSFGLDAALSKEQAYEKLRSRCGNLTVDPQTGKEQYSPVTEEEKRTVQVLARLRELEGIQDDTTRLRAMQAGGVDKELERHQNVVHSVYGADTFSPEHQARLEREATEYLRGLQSKIEHSSDAERQALIAERDAIEWRVAGNRLALSLDPSRADAASAKLTLQTFLTDNNRGGRSKPFVEAAEGVLAAIQQVEKYREKSISLSAVKKNAEEKLEALLKIDQKLSLKDLSTASPKQTFLAGTEKNKQHLLGKIVGAAPIAESELMSAERQHGLKLGGSTQEHADLQEDWLAVQGSARLARQQLTHTSLSPTRGFLSKSASEAPEQRVVEATAGIHDVVRREAGSHFDAVELKRLRTLAAHDPRLQAAFASIPDSLISVDPKEESRFLLAQLSPEDQQRARLLTSVSERSKQPASELVASTRKLSGEALSVALDFELARAKVHRVQSVLDSLPAEDRPKVEALFAQIHGRSIGSTLLEARPLGGGGVQMLLTLSATTVVSSADLEKFFPTGAAIPADPGKRTEILAALAKKDATVQFLSAEERKAHDEATKKLAQSRGHWLAVEQTAAASGNTVLASRARAERHKLDQAVKKSSDDLLGRYSPDYVARAGHRELFTAVQSHRDHSVAASALAADSRYASTSRRIVDALREAPADHVKATELMRRGSFSEAETALVGAFYADQAKQKPVSERQRALTGDLARDLSKSSDPNDPETKRAALLARGGQGNLSEADIMLAVDAVARGDKRDSLRAIVALKAVGALHEANELLKKLPLSSEARQYAEAVKNDDTVRQIGFELKSGLETGVISSAEALSAVKGMGSDALQQLGSVAGLGDAMGNFKPAWEQIVTPGMYEDGVKLAATTALTLNDSQSMLASFALLSPEKAGELSAHLDRSAPGGKWLEHVRSRDGWAGVYDAALMEQVVGLGATGRAFSPEQLAKLRALRESVGEQMVPLTELYVARDGLNKKSHEIWQQVLRARTQAENEESNAPVLSFVCSSYGLRIENHQDFLKKQEQLCQAQYRGMSDILQTKRVMTVMSVVMLKDIIKEQAEGIKLSHIDTEHSDLRKRDVQRDCWVIARPEHLETWQVLDQRYRENIHRWELGAEAVQCVTKVVVVGAVTFFGTPASGFLVATAWNGLDKAYQVSFNGVDLNTAMWRFGTEGFFDVVFMGISGLKFGTVVSSPGKAVEGLGQKAMQELSEGVSKRLWRLDIFGKTRQAIKLNKAGTDIVVHAAELKGGLQLVEGGGAKLLEKPAQLVAEKMYFKLAEANTGLQSMLVSVAERSLWWTSGFGGLTPLLTEDRGEKRQPELRIETPITPPPVEAPAPPVQIKPPVVVEPVIEPQAVVDRVAIEKARELVEQGQQALKDGYQAALEKLQHLSNFIEKERERQAAEQFKQFITDVQVAASPLIAAVAAEIKQIVHGENKEQKLDQVAPLPADPRGPDVDKTPPADEKLFGNFGGVFDNFIVFADRLNTGSIFNFSQAPVIASQNFPPLQPPPPPVHEVKKDPPPPPPKPGFGPTLSPSADETINTYVIQLRQEQKLAEAQAVARADQLAEAAKNQQASAHATAVASQQQLGQQQSLAVGQAQTQESSQAVAQEGAAAFRMSAEAIAQRSASAQQSATSEGQQQPTAFAQSQSEPVRLQESVSAEAAPFAIASTSESRQRRAAQAAANEEQQIALAALVENPQGKKLQAASPVRLAESAEQAAERAANEAQIVAVAERQAAVSQAKQRQAEREASVALEREVELLVAQREVRESGRPLGRGISANESGAEATNGRAARGLAADLRGSLGQGSAELMPLEKLEAALQAIEADEQGDDSLDDEHRRARKAKALKAKARLREILIHQLQSVLFDQARKERTLRLLIALGISESEYRALVAQIGEMEAQAEAQREEGRKQARAATVPQEEPQRTKEALSISSSTIPGKTPLRMKEPESPPAPSKAPAAANRVSRAELYVRMKE